MKNRKLGRKIRYSIFIISIANIVLLGLWFYVRANPLISQIREVKNKVHDVLLSEDYHTIIELSNLLNSIKDKNNFIYVIKNSKNETIGEDINSKYTLQLDSQIFILNGESYMITIYSNYHLSLSKLIIEVLAFEVIIVTIIYFITFLYVRKIFIFPLNRVMEDIQKYKKGQMPKKITPTSEYDFIHNVLVDLAENIEKEKSEQSRIIASISHDLKTPLTSILGYSDLIKENSNSMKEVKLYNEKIIVKAEHMRKYYRNF